MVTLCGDPLTVKRGPAQSPFQCLETLAHFTETLKFQSYNPQYHEH